jgi:hypothetical protein
VLSHAYVPAISIHVARPFPPKRDHRDKPGDDGKRISTIFADAGNRSQRIGLLAG